MARHSSGLSRTFMVYNVVVGRDIVLGLSKRTFTNVKGQKLYPRQKHQVALRITTAKTSVKCTIL